MSSFGLSGTNAHAVLEEAPPREEAPATENFRPIVLSAQNPEALAAQAERLRERLESDPGLAVADVAWTLARRATFEQRAVVVAADRTALLEGLRTVAGGGASGGRLAVLFSGQGSQLPQMGAELERTFPVYRAALEEVVSRLGPEVGEMLRAPAGSAAAARLEGTWGAQTGLFAMQVALYRLWESWGLQPDYLLGHSIGELTAAHVSGILTLEDACELVKERARLLESLPAGGAMVAVEASEAEVSGETEVEVAAVNGPRSVVLSGEEEAVAAVAARWAAAGRRTRRLAVSHAFHSQRTEPILAELEEVGRRLRPGLGRIPVVSNVTGAIGEAYREPGYWSRQVRMPVRFQEGIKTLERAGVTTYLELGPQGVLCGMGASCVTEGSAARWVAPLRRGKSEVEGTLRAAGELYADGRAVDWQAVVGPLGGRRISLPTYPFQRERFWLEAEAAPEHGAINLDALADDTDPDLDEASRATVRAMLPALSAWQGRRRERESARAGSTKRCGGPSIRRDRKRTACGGWWVETTRLPKQWSARWPDPGAGLAALPQGPM